MSGITNDVLIEDSQKLAKRSLLQRYLKNPFSWACSKLANLFQPTQYEVLENERYEQYQTDIDREKHFYLRFTDRVDPSLYYSIFFPHRRF
jgi:hypothetical protein